MGKRKMPIGRACVLLIVVCVMLLHQCIANDHWQRRVLVKGMFQDSGHKCVCFKGKTIRNASIHPKHKKPDASFDVHWVPFCIQCYHRQQKKSFDNHLSSLARIVFSLSDHPQPNTNTLTHSHSPKCLTLRFVLFRCLHSPLSVRFSLIFSIHCIFFSGYCSCHLFVGCDGWSHAIPKPRLRPILIPCRTSIIFKW